ncbi:MAG: YjcQ family protein [Enterocloster sp.]
MECLADCGYPRRVALTRPEITLKGLSRYLEENTLMKKAANLAKGIQGYQYQGIIAHPDHSWPVVFY